MDSLERLKGVEPERMVAHGFLTRSPDGNFICPHCKNGSHDHGTGISFVEEDGIFKAYCHKCTTNFDNIKIFAEVYHLNWRDKRDFVEIINRASKEFFGDDAMNNQHNTQEAKSAKQKKEKKFLDCSELYTLAQKNLPDFLQEHGGSYRALPQHILNHAGVGFLRPQDYKHFSTELLPQYFTYRYPALIIPTCKTAYQARFICEGAKIRYSSYKDMQKTIFLFDDLKQVQDGEFVFLTEGYIDAMSILTAGFKAIAIAGQALTEYYQNQLKTLATKPRFIVLLDRDVLKSPQTKDNPDKIIESLKKIGFDACKFFLPEFARKADGNVVPIKDANDFLQANPDDLKMCLETIVTEAEESFAHTDDAEDDFEPELEDKTSQREKYSSSDKERTSKQILDDCPVDVHCPEGFSWALDGSVWKEFKSEDHLPEEVLPFPLLISERKFDDTHAGAQYTICWKKTNRKKWRFISSVPAENIADSRALAKVLSSNGIQVDSKMASRLSTYCAGMLNDPENVDRIPRKFYYKKTGWNKDFTNFVYPTNDDGDFPMQNGNFGFETAFESKGDAKTQTDLLVTTIFENFTSRQTIGAFAVAPAIRPLLGENAQNFLVHLHGTSGSGKTAICLVGAGIYGNPSELKGSFASTPKYIIERAHAFNDLPCYIDELQAMQVFRRDHFDTFLYTLEQGNNPGRLNKDAQAKKVSRSHYMFISTGEQPITTAQANQGAINRVLQLDGKNICPAALATKIYETSAEHYGHLGLPIIRWLKKAENRQKLKEFYYHMRNKIRYRAAKVNGYNKSFEEFKRDGCPLEVIGLIDRHVASVAVNLTGLHMIGEVVSELFQQDYKDLHRSIDTLIDEDIDTFIKNSTSSMITSNGLRALPVVLETTLRDPARFGRENAKGQFYSGERGINNLGYITLNDDLRLIPSAFHSLIKELGYSSSQEIIKAFHDLGVLDEGDCKKHLYQKKINLTFTDGHTESRWMYVLKANAEELVEENRLRLIEKLVA